MYSLAIYLYMLCANIVSLFNKKARLMMRGHHQAWKILRQKIGDGVYGKSITDKCLSWNTTEQLLRELAHAVAARRWK